MNSSRLQLLRRLATITSILILVLIILGGFVTASESGLGCGAHWPLCHGRLIPPNTFHAWVEWSHRLVAGVVSLMIVLVNGVIWLKPSPRRLKVLGLVGLGLLITQVLLGAAIVFNGLAALIVAIHMGTALLLMDVFSAIAVLAAPVKLGFEKTGAGPVLWALVILSEATATMGSYVAHATSSHSCDGFNCLTTGMFGGAGLPLLLHMMLAFSLAVVLVILFRSWKVERLPKPSRTYLVVAIFLYGAQALVGLIMLALHVPDPLLSLHQSIGSGVEISFFMAALHQATTSFNPAGSVTNPPTPLFKHNIHKV